MLTPKTVRGFGFAAIALLLAVFVLAAAPTQTTPLLNATNNSNSTATNLTVYPQTTDADGDPVSNITTWYVDGKPYATIYLPFQGGALGPGGTAKDYSGNGLDATITSLTWNDTGGHDGFGGYEFTGSVYAQIADDSLLDITDEITISVWVKPASTSSNYDRVVGRPWATDSSPWNAYMINRIASTQQYSFNIGVGTSLGYGSTTTSQATLGQWTHLVGVYNGTHTVIYFNGEPENPTAASGTIGVNDRPLRIGGNYYGREYYPGAIDDVMIFDRALSPEQVKVLYNDQLKIVSNETNAGEQWQACITPNDQNSDGLQKCSNILTIAGGPSQSAPILNATDHPTNSTSANLTVYNQSTASKNIINWYVNGSSVASLNLPFDGGLIVASNTTIRDYSGYAKHATPNGSTYNGTGGFDGKGAYEFDGVASHIDIPDDSIPLTSDFTITTRVKTQNTSKYQHIIQSYTGSGNGRFTHYINGGGLSVFVGQTVNLGLSYGGIQNNTWYFTTVRREGNNMSYFVNGAYVDSGTLTSDIQAANQAIGNAPDDSLYSSRNFYGTIDEVAVYSYALTDEQVLALYNNRTDLIVSQETSIGDVWQACMTPTNNSITGPLFCSNELEIINGSRPTHATPVLNASDGINSTNANLTVYNQSTNDSDGDSVKNIIDWRLDGASIAILNMPFEGGLKAESNTKTKDYANGFNGTVGGATYNATGGYDGFGAYEFDGIDDYINITGIASGAQSYTFSFWTKSSQADETYNYLLDSEEGRLVLGYFSNTSGYLGYYDGTWHPIADAPNDGAWHNIIFRLDNDTSNGSVYIDGGYVGSDTYTGVSLGSGTVLGQRYFLGASWFNGTMDDVQIYGRALSDEQILAIAQNRTDLIVSQETSPNEAWTACITPNDGQNDGVERCSELSIQAPPTITNAAINDTSNVSINTSVKVNASVIDLQENLANVTLQIDSPDLAPYNVSAISAGGDLYEYNITLNESGQWVFIFFANDTLGNDATAAIAFDGGGRSFIEVNHPPQHSAPVLNATDFPTNDTSANLTVYNQSTSELEGSSVKNIQSWFVNGAPYAKLILPFEGGSNSTYTRDYSNNSNDGIVNGAIYNATGGYDGFGAYEFDGTSHINVSGFKGITGTNPRTVTAWIKVTGPDTLLPIVAWGTNAAGQKSVFRVQAVNGANDTIRYEVNGGYAIGSTNVSDGNWHFVAMTWENDGSPDVTDTILYVDGVEETLSDSVTETMNTASGYDVRIGTDFSSNYFNGTIDELRMYERVLSAEQIAALYNNRTDLIVSQETSGGDTWQACVTPNDGSQDGEELCSDSLSVAGAITYWNCPDESGTWVVSTDYTLQLDVDCYNITITNTSTLTVEQGNYLKSTYFTVDSGSVVTANNEGGAGGACANDGSGTSPGTISEGGTVSIYDAGGGGAHGGDGGNGASNGAGGGYGGSSYGDPLQPTTTGSGGGGGWCSYASGGDGAGNIMINASVVTIDGSITANGGVGSTSNPSYSMGGGGSGGSIWITTNEFTGSGSIAANGASGSSGGSINGGGGAGGRIAIYYNTSDFSPSSVTVNGGAGYASGERGTAILVDIDDNDAWIVGGFEFANSVQAPLGTFKNSTSDWVFQNLTLLQSSITIRNADNVTTQTLNISSTTIVCDSGTEQWGFRYNNSLNNVYAENTATFDFDELYRSSLTFTACNQLTFYENTSYSYMLGGYSTTANNDVVVDNPLLNSISDITLSAGTDLTFVNASLIQNITSSSLTTGSDLNISAATDAFTIYAGTLNIGDDFFLDLSGSSTNYNITLSDIDVGDDVNITSLDSFWLEDSDLSLGDMIINTTTLELVSSNFSSRVTVYAENMTIGSGSSFDSYQKGGAGGACANDGSGTSPGTISEGGTVSIYDAGGGGAHGGDGGNGASNGAGGGYGGSSYGDPLQPTTTGSGGGGGWCSYASGGDGAGSILLNITDTLSIDGSLTANGKAGTTSNPSYSMGGGGSGGSIWIVTKNLTGSGSITANGASGSSGGSINGGGGAGGRVAIYFNSTNFDMSSSTVNGGSGYQSGEKGTGIFVDRDDNNAWVFGGFEFLAAENTSLGSFKPTTASDWNFNTLTFIESSITLRMDDNVTATTLNISSTSTITCDSGTEQFGFRYNNNDQNFYTDNSAGIDFDTLYRASSLTFSSCNQINVYENTSAATFFDGYTTAVNNYIGIHNTQLATITGATITSSVDINISNSTNNLLIDSSTFNAADDIFIDSNDANGVMNFTSSDIDAGDDIVFGYITTFWEQTSDINAGDIILNTSTVDLVSSQFSARATVHATNMTVSSGSSFDSYQKGGAGGACQTDGSGTSPGTVSEGGTMSIYDAGGGGAHGGDGGNGASNGAGGGYGGSSYGNSTNPVTNGSGGGGAWCNYGTGGDGGGTIFLNITDTLTNDGTIQANGEDGTTSNPSYTMGGGGGGGSIWIITDTFEGNCVISATGGSGDSGGTIDAGGGGGGRIALYYTQSTKPYAEIYNCISVDGGLGYQAGGDGTIYLYTENTAPIVANVTVNTTSAANFSTDNVTAYWDSYDAESSPIKNVTNWYRNGSSLMILNMPFDGGRLAESNTTVKDYSGSSNHGTVSGAIATKTNGYDGLGGYDFDGVNDYITLGDVAAMDAPSEFTIALWFNRDADVSDQTNHGLNNILLAQASSAENDNFELGINQTNVGLYMDTADYDATQVYSGSINNDQWYHLALVYDSSASEETKLYLDGVNVQNWTEWGGVLDTSAGSEFAIGMSRPSSSNWGAFDGTIDDVQIWNIALSDEQVAALNNSRNDLIVSQETVKTETWRVCVTPIDGDAEGTSSCSNTLTIATSEPVISSANINDTSNVSINTSVLVSATVTDSQNNLDTVLLQVDDPSNAPYNVSPTPSGSTYSYAITLNDTGQWVFTFFANDTEANDALPIIATDGDSNEYIEVGIVPPIQDTPVLNATDNPINSTSGNLTVYNQSTFDGDGDSVKNIINWKLDGSGIMTLNMPFEAGSSDDTLLTKSNTDWSATVQGANNWYYYNSTQGTNNYAELVSGGTFWSLAGGGGSCTPTCDYYTLVYQTSTHPGITSDAVRAWNSTYTGTIRAEIRITDANTGCGAGITYIVKQNTQQVYSGSFNNGFATQYINLTLDVSEGDMLYFRTNEKGDNSCDSTTEYIDIYALGSTPDLSGNGNDASVHNVSYNVTGGYDGWGAYEFAGHKNSYLNLSNTALNGLGDLTLTLWMKTTNTNQAIMSGATSGYTNEFLFYQPSNTSLRLHTGEAGDPSVDMTVPAISDGAWHHVALVRDATNDEVIAYVDGVNSSVQSTTLSALTIASNGLFLGQDQDSVGGGFDSAQSFDGWMDDIQLYNRVLSAEQIQAIYNNRTDLIVSQETADLDQWQACITPLDALQIGDEACSNTVTVYDDTPPTHSTPILNATDHPLNYTTANLTVYNQSTYDVTGDPVKNIINYKVDGSSITALNMPFEGGAIAQSNTRTKDYSGNGNNGTITGATFNATGGHDGKGAYEFDGVNDDIAINGVAADITGDVTIAAWVKHLSEDSEDMPIAVNDVSGGNVLLLRMNSGGSGGDFSAYTTASTISSTVDITDGTWHHIAYTREGTSAAIYVDGIVNGTGTHTFSFSSNDQWSLGQEYDSGIKSNFFNGSIDDVLIFNRALSAEQILAIYNNRTDLIVSQETGVGEQWQACVTPNDGTSDGTEKCSNLLTITSETNSVPTHTTPVLNATDKPVNSTNANLTVYNQSTSDLDGDSVKNIISWHVNGSPVTVLHMPFEGGSNSTYTKDYSNNSNDGTVTGATWASTGGYDNKGAYEFDGATDYINTSDESLFDFQEFSIEAWAYPLSTDAGYTQGIVGKETGASADGFVLGQYNGNWYFWVSGTNIRNASSFSLNTWQHVIGTYNGSVMRLYVDGILVNSTTATLVNNNDSLLVGRWYREGNSARIFNGTIDEVRIFNRSLSPEQVLALYNNRTNLIVSQETSTGDNWTACITPNDGTEDGVEKCSNSVTITSGANNPPTHGTPILNATDNPTNSASANLTVYNQSTADIEGDSVKNIISWHVNGSPITVLHMPFEGGSNSTYTKDYSNLSNDGIVTSATWSGTGGYDGLGAYEFDGSSEYIIVTDDATLNITGEVTVCAYTNRLGSNSARQDILTHRTYTDASNNGGYFLDFRGDQSDQFRFCTFNDGAAECAEYTYATTGTWNLWCGVFNGTNNILYQNGIERNSASSSGPGSDQGADLTISSNTYSFNGTIDDVWVFNRSLSAEQIIALYNNRTDLIVSQETSIGDNWTACVTPNDGTEDGTEKCSNTVTIASATDTCAYTSGDWMISLEDNCVLSTDTDVYPNRVFIIGASGSFTLDTGTTLTTKQFSISPDNYDGDVRVTISPSANLNIKP